MVLHLVSVADQAVCLMLTDAMDRMWGAHAMGLGQTILHIWSAASLLVPVVPVDHLDVRE